MESAQHIDGETDVSPVFGALPEEQQAQVVEQLRLVDARLLELRERLGDDWASDGLLLESLPSGQASVRGEVRSQTGDVWFAAELRPRNYFSEQNPWRPGQPPRPMQTDAWHVDAFVHVAVVRHVLNKKYRIEETAAEIEERRFDSAPEAAAGLLSAVVELTDLALSRDPTVEAWAPAETP
jgi:hypothetical protein